MCGETEALVRDVESSLDLLRKRMGWETARHRLEEFDARVGDPTLWDDPPAARRLMQDRQALLDAIEAHDSIKGDLGALVDLIGMAGDEEDAEVLSEAETELASLSRVAATRVSDALLDGEADANDAFLEINAGPGGTESCDWAMMLTRMYLRWAERRGYDWELQAESEGDEAGVRSATYRINGRNAHGWLKSEAGLHRLVRISPFDSADRRHTSFGSVQVYPVVDDAIEIEVNPADVRVDTFRASGAGGQHVNTTDSAVRITHVPTGIVTQSSQKSQHQNREIAMRALRSRLYQAELDRRRDEISDVHDARSGAGWGSQIRNYVMQPHQMVKDLRTGHETSNVKDVLDGDLDAFMAATLALDVTGMSRAEAQDEA